MRPLWSSLSRLARPWAGQISVLHRNLASTPARSKAAPQGASEPLKKKFPARLVVYHAGTARTSWLAACKATTIFQFGIACMLIAPIYYYRESTQPDKKWRVLTAAGIIVVGMLPMLTLSYCTAPFVNTVIIHIPEYARRSRELLDRFSQFPPASTPVEIITIRSLPWPKTTDLVLGELRPLSPRWARFANFHRVLSSAARARLAQRSVWQKLFALMAEQRTKFYIKPGRFYTSHTPGPGVWENLAQAIQNQTLQKTKPVKLIR